MPVEFLTDERRPRTAVRRAAVAGRAGPDVLPRRRRQRLVAKRRGDHMRLGFALQLTTVRYLGTFLTDPLDVPPLVTGAPGRAAGDRRPVVREAVYRAADHAVRAPRTRSRPPTGCGSSPRPRKSSRAWVDARAWTTGDGPKTIFADGGGAGCVERGAAAGRDDTGPAGGPGPGRGHRRAVGHAGRRCSPAAAGGGRLERLVVVPDGARCSELERWRQGPSKPSGPEPGARRWTGSPRSRGTGVGPAGPGGGGAAPAGGRPGPVRDGGQRAGAAPARRPAAAGDAAGDGGLPGGQGGRRRPGAAGPADDDRAAGQGRDGRRARSRRAGIRGWPGTRRGWPPRWRCCSRSPDAARSSRWSRCGSAIEAVVLARASCARRSTRSRTWCRRRAPTPTRRCGPQLAERIATVSGVPEDPDRGHRVRRHRRGRAGRWPRCRPCRGCWTGAPRT